MDIAGGVTKAVSSVVGGVFGYLSEKERTKQIYETVWAKDRELVAQEAFQARATMAQSQKFQAISAVIIIVGAVVVAVAHNRKIKEKNE